MIDTHVHVVPPNLPGVGPLSPVLRGSTDNVARIVREQMQAGGFHAAFAMGSLSNFDEDPLGIQRTLQIAEHVPGLYPIGIANPERTDPEFLRRVESEQYKRVAIGHPEWFDRYLPFAMAFGVEKKWARAFEGIYTQSPNWYVGPSVTHFSASRFSSSLGNLSSAASSTLASSPRSSSGSGFGGGGSSGGGGGGGGGGGF